MITQPFASRVRVRALAMRVITLCIPVPHLVINQTTTSFLHAVKRTWQMCCKKRQPASLVSLPKKKHLLFTVCTWYKVYTCRTKLWQCQHVSLLLDQLLIIIWWYLSHNMYVGVYLCVFVWVHACVSVHVCVYACMRGCIYACMRACMNVCVSVCIYVYMYMSVEVKPWRPIYLKNGYLNIPHIFMYGSSILNIRSTLFFI